VAHSQLASILVIASVAALAPIVVALRLPLRLPIVVAEIALGILIGPQGLGLAKLDPLIDFLGQFGLGFLFFLAGLEIDFARIRGRPAALAAMGWLISIAAAFLIAGLLQAIGFVLSTLLVGVALSTTALGTLMPILRDSGEMETRLGTFVLAAGAVGEFGPIVLTALLLSGTSNHLASAILLLVFTALAVGAAVIALHFRPPRLLRLIAQAMHASAQLAVRLSLLILLGFLFLADSFGLDVLLGAFAAGVIVSMASTREQAEPLREKLEGIGFGFLIPIFFISSGMRFDLRALFQSAESLLRLPVFLALFLVVRGLPVLLYRRDLPRADLAPLALFSATALPMVVAITSIGVATGRMRPDNAAALVGAGMISVFLHPVLALTLRQRTKSVPTLGAGADRTE
jgi:Kef-type K+ transport system membrane component KefB